MNWTCNAGVTFYRMINFAKYMRKEPNVSLAYSDFNPKRGSIADWELNLHAAVVTGDIEAQNRVTNDIDVLMDVADISIWQMVHTAASYSLFRAYRDKVKNKKTMVTEIDDYIFGVNPESMAYVSYHPNSDLETYAGWQIRNSHHVIVSTEYLKQQYLRLNPNITVIPNSIDFDIWDKLSNKKQRGRIRIGWAGGGAHVQDLKVISKVIPIILKKYDKVDFVFMGAMPDYIKTSARITHLNDWYGIDDYPHELAKLGIDIGLAPLRDNQFNRAKSNLRWLEYSALKIPTVASPVEPFNDKYYVGCYALEVEDWVDRLSELIDDRGERERLGKNAYDVVKTNFNVEVIAIDYLKVLKKLVKGKLGINIKLFDEDSQGKMYTVNL